MSVYEFNTDFTPTTSGAIDVAPPGSSQLSHLQHGRVDWFSKYSGDPADIEDFLMPGFRSLDEAMKMWWSGMRVPTKDSYRFCRIKVAGGSKSVMVWRDELRNGRARMPVASLTRGKEDFNKDRYSPSYHPMAVRMPSSRSDLAVMVCRPTPWLVDYTLSVHCVSKRDAEYINYQVLTRFNPLATFRMSDGRLTGDATVRFGGGSDQSERETQADQSRLVKYEYSMTVEAWLPLPERVVKTVIGMVTNVGGVGDNFNERLKI